MRECRFNGWCYHSVGSLVSCDGHGMCETRYNVYNRPCEHYAPMPDVDALTELATILNGANTDLCARCMFEGCAGAKCAIGIARAAADKIVESLGDYNADA